MNQDTSPSRSDAPPLGALADPDDDAGWDRDKHGPMAAYAAPDDAVQTVVPPDGATDY